MNLRIIDNILLPFFKLNPAALNHLGYHQTCLVNSELYVTVDSAEGFVCDGLTHVVLDTDCDHIVLSGINQCDINHFKEGAYSKLSEQLKANILAYSELPFDTPNPNGGFYHHPLIVAICSDHKIRQDGAKYLARYFDVDETVITPDMELYFKPSDEEFITL